MGGRRGSILVLVLFVMTVLSLVAVSFAYRASLMARTVQHRLVMTRLRAHAASAVSIAVGRLGENVNDFDHRAEAWHTHRHLATEDWLPEWSASDHGQPSAFMTEYSVIDEESKLRAASASSEALERLGMSAGQIASLFDWMDGDDAARAEGAENEYYLTLAVPYRCKNAPLELLDELLLVRGFGVEDYLGEDRNHNRMLDPSENDGGVLYPPDDADGRLRQGWADLLTCYGDGRINLNTAPRLVLETLPLSGRAVDQIIGYRAFDQDSSGDLEDHVFKSTSDIDQLQGLEEWDRHLLAHIATYRSEFFRVFALSTHAPTGLTYRVQAVVRMSGDLPQILHWKVGL